jgi:lipoprotein-anchoring transpeptidase ErfK/SrfK
MLAVKHCVRASRFGALPGLGIVAALVGLALMWSSACSAQYYSSQSGHSYQDIEQAPLSSPTGRSAPPAYPPTSPSNGDRAYNTHLPNEMRAEPAAPPSPSTRPDDWQQGVRPPAGIQPIQSSSVPPGAVASLSPEYQAEQGQPKELPPHLRRQIVFYPTKEPAGMIIIDTPNTYLYLVRGNNKAIRYGIGVGREGFTWSGRERITKVAEWPDWTPPKEMIERQPYLPRFMAGGPTNPLGARALYLGSTAYRIHGTNQPSTIGTFVSSGCIRLTNADIEDLYTRVQVGTRVVVLPGGPPASGIPSSAYRPSGVPPSNGPLPQAQAPSSQDYRQPPTREHAPPPADQQPAQQRQQTLTHEQWRQAIIDEAQRFCDRYGTDPICSLRAPMREAKR